MDLYVDGSYSDLSKKGAWSICHIDSKKDSITYKKSSSMKSKGSHRCELMAILRAAEYALETIKQNKSINEIKIISDSKQHIDYLNSIFTGRDTKHICIKKIMGIKKDRDIMMPLLNTLYDIYFIHKSNFRLIWVKGHSGNKGNDIAHALAIDTLRKKIKK